MTDREAYILDLENRIKTLEEKLAQALRYEEALDAAGFDVWENNFETGNALGSNVKLFTALGYGPDELPSSVEDLLAIVHPGDQEKAALLMQEHFSGKTDRYKAELRVRAKDGSWVWMGNYGQVRARNPKGVVTKFIGVNFNIDQRRIMEEAMKFMAYSDDLTKLGNRRKFFEQGAEEVEKALRYKRPLAIIFADVDRFKYINDTFGHQMGDQVLRDYAACLEETLRHVDIKCRYGGDEFLVLMPETDLPAAYQSALRLNRAVSQMTTGIDMEITTSIGVAALTEGDSLETLVKKADCALYWAKEQGRNTVVKN